LSPDCPCHDATIPEEHADVGFAGAPEHPLIDIDAEETVMKLVSRFSKEASHCASCQPRPGLAEETGDSVHFDPERVELHARFLSVGKNDLARNGPQKFEFARLSAGHDICLLRNLAQYTPRILRQHSEIKLACRRCKDADMRRRRHLQGLRSLRR